MPFSTRVVPPRTDIREVYAGTTQNILEKTAVSNMVGVLHQLNFVSKYATEVFADLFAQTEKTGERIKKVRERVKNVAPKVPKQEKLFIDNSPMFFYDNPYMGKEYQRRDPNQGLLFRRDRSTTEVNRRRIGAEMYPDFTALDQFSNDGQPNVTKFSDPKFFINEWLAAEERKIKEEKRKRKQMRAEKKARKDNGTKVRRQKTTKVLQVKRKRFDPTTGKEIIDDEDHFTDLVAPKGDKRASSNKFQPKSPTSPTSPMSNGSKSPQMSASPIPQQQRGPGPSSPQMQSNPRVPPPGPQGGGRPPPHQMQPQQPAPPQAYSNGAHGGGGPGGGAGRPPPIPNMGGQPPPMHIPQNNNIGRPPPNPGQLGGQGGGHMQMQPSYAQIPQSAPVQDNQQSYQQPAKVMPAFLLQLQGKDAKSNLRQAPEVERQKPMDSRSAMLAALHGNKAKKKLVKVDMEEIQRQKEANKPDESTLVAELMKRRAFLDDDSDDDDSDDSADWDD